MKCHFNEAAMDSTKEKSSAAESKVLHLKSFPVKQPTPTKPSFLTAETTTVLFPTKNTRTVHNKENSASRDHEGTLDEISEDSGYLSLHTSQIDENLLNEDIEQVVGKPTAVLSASALRSQEKTVLSPSKRHGRTNSSHPVSLSFHTPVEKRRPVALSSTPSTTHSDPNLPILKFQQTVCQELAKSYKKNKRYDWSIVSKVAEDHLLDRVIGRQMGLDYVDMFASLLSRNMKSILTKTLSLLGDMDLISCKKVSKTWRKIICEDAAALSRCQQAEEALRESRNSLRHRACGLTRDLAESRVLFSCMQSLASSSSSPSLSAQTGGINRRIAASQKGSSPNSQLTRFTEYMQAAGNLKQHQSLRSCKRCGSPATHLPEVRRATCSRPSCLFDFCTCCQEPFHGSTPCRTVQPRSNCSSSKTTGNARSKRSLRRL